MITTIKGRFLQLILVIFSLLVLSSCASPRDENNASGEPVMDDDVKEVVNIAIIMPLSGKDGELGRQYSRMIKMGIADGAKSKIQLYSYDGGGDIMLEDTIAKMVDQDIDIIIGPILSDDTQKIADKMKNRSVIIVSLSNNPAIADKNLFVMGHAPMKQMTQITNHFLNNNYKNYLMLFPSGNYSATSSKVLQEQIMTAGGIVAKTEFYANDVADIDRAVASVSDLVDSLNEVDTNLTRPVVLVADDQYILNALFASIKKYNLDKKAVIAGDNRLDMNFPNKIDAIYTGSWNITDTDVKQRAERFDIKNISFMHAIAYDAGKIVAVAIGEHYKQEEFLARMNKFNPFAGISGNIRFYDSTVAQRQYDFIRREDGAVHAIESSPASAKAVK